MGILGSLLLLFLVVHLSHFWIDTKIAVFTGKADKHNTFNEMKEVFSNWYIVALYLIGVGSSSSNINNAIKNCIFILASLFKSNKAPLKA